MRILNKKELTKLLSYIIMGDGGVYRRKEHHTAHFIMNMKKDNLDYVEFCKSVLENVTTCVITDRTLQDDGYTRQPQVTLSSKSHPTFTKLRDRIYTGTYKGIDPHALKLLDFESLAILYMSDGSYSEDFRPEIGMVNVSHRVTLNMKRLSYGDQFILKKALKDLLDLEWNINRNGKFYYLTLRTKDVSKFMEGVAPYILPSFEYKLLKDLRTVSPS
jgi:recombination protein RecA